MKNTQTSPRNRNNQLRFKLSQKNLYTILIFLAIILLGLIILSIPFRLNASIRPKNLSVVPANRNTKTLISPNPVPTQKITFNDSITSQISSFCVNVPVLFYHHVEPMDEAKTEGHPQLTVDSGVFENQLIYLRNHNYVTITAEDLVRDIINHKNPPTKAIVLTLDDGYDDAYQYAYPLAKKYNVVLNLVIPTGLLGGSGYLTWSQLKEMVSSGLITAYDHTIHHYAVSGNTQKIQEEIIGAKQDLENNLGTPIDIFTYPYGTTSPAAVKILTQNGFIGAFTTKPGTVNCETNLMYLHRTRVGNSNLSSYGLH